MLKRFRLETFLNHEKLVVLMTSDLGSDADILRKPIKEPAKAIVEQMQQGLENMELSMSAISAKRLIELFSQDNATRGQMREIAKELDQRLRDEISSAMFLTIPKDRIRFLTEPNLFGEEVADHFSSAILDIEEAGNCLALSRGTACVFHLMRVMEVGLRVLSKTLNDPSLDPKRNPNWDSILRKCRDELEKLTKDRSQEWKTNDIFFAAAVANLMAVKTAWRNPTMHVEITYDDEKARDVWNSVGGFMRHLATNLHE